jgi:hypothetical protein
MPDTAIDLIVTDLRQKVAALYPHRGELKNVRIVGHTPKSDHFIYDVVADFEHGSERIAAKVYRGKAGQAGKTLAKTETENLNFAHAVAEKKKLTGIPRPIGDYSELSAVVAEKFSGLPLQSLIMKAALLPGVADRGDVFDSAAAAGRWLKAFHKATAGPAEMFDGAALIRQVEKLCENCRGEGLDDASIHTILSAARKSLAGNRKTLPSSTVLNDFTPLNITVRDDSVGICDYAKLARRGTSFNDVAQFLACVEALEKYPFCDRTITARVQDAFLDAYAVTASDRAVLRVLKLRTLLSLFAQGRTIKESALRKKIMWANVMKKFMHQAARRSLASAA